MFAAEEVWPTDSSVLETCFSRFKHLRLIDFLTLKHLRYLSLQRNYELRNFRTLFASCRIYKLSDLADANNVKNYQENKEDGRSQIFHINHKAKSSARERNSVLEIASLLVENKV